jgi:hypothetical protein
MLSQNRVKELSADQDGIERSAEAVGQTVQDAKAEESDKMLRMGSPAQVVVSLVSRASPATR